MIAEPLATSRVLSCALLAALAECEFLAIFIPIDVGAYVNYIDPLLTNWKQEYYGDNYAELLCIKKAWDPSGRFTFQQAVDSPFEPTSGNFAPLFRTFIA